MIGGRWAPGRRATRAGSGQGLVEFALVLPIFFLLMFGLIDGGRLVYQNSVVSQAAREGARLAAVEASWMGSTDPGCGKVGGPICPANVTTLRAHVLAATNRMMAPFIAVADADLFTRCDLSGGGPTVRSWNEMTCTDHATGNVVSVRVQSTYTPLTPGLSLLGSIVLTGSSSMVIN
jgi:hypothetical protein